MSTYIELLMDPRWQRRRLEVMQRSGFRCECCGDETRTLHIHHLGYGIKTKPWEVPAECLECLCEVCHEFRTDFDALYERSKVPTKVCWHHYCSWDRIKGYFLSGRKEEPCASSDASGVGS